jgi:hypothetical protein
MDKFVNLSILRNPLNWLSIGAMIAIVVVGGFVIYSRISSGGTGLNDGASNLATEA